MKNKEKKEGLAEDNSLDEVYRQKTNSGSHKTYEQSQIDVVGQLKIMI